MSRFTISIPVGIMALALALAGTPGWLEGQSTGVLQATARVVDYHPSLASLKVARTAVRAHHSPRKRAFGPAVVDVAHPQTPSHPALRSEPIVVTINYLQ